MRIHLLDILEKPKRQRAENELSPLASAMLLSLSRMAMITKSDEFSLACSSSSLSSHAVTRQKDRLDRERADDMK